MRPPSLDEKNNLKLVLTITTDLGDSFLAPEQPVAISVYIHQFLSGPTSSDPKVRINDGRTSWKAGMRVLKLSLPLPPQAMRKIQDMRTDDKSMPRIRIVASGELVDPPNIAEIPFDSEGRILGLSAPFPWPGQEPCFTATRDFTADIDGLAKMLSVDEEIGESIDRHVWDAGVVTTGLIIDMCRTMKEPRWRKTPLLQDVLRSIMPEHPLNVIELGCGVGILSIGLATALDRQQTEDPLNGASTDDGLGPREPPASADPIDDSADAPLVNEGLGRILLTDLPDAEELTRTNIHSYSRDRQAVELKNGSLDFESLDWEDGQNGVFGPRASKTAWDLIIISDCTYNVDMLSALVKTLSALHKSSLSMGNTVPKVMLATKPRHSSEKALFDLMKADGWEILESASQPLPVLGSEDEKIEIYLFGEMAKYSEDGREPSTTSGAKRRKLG